jgi:hypothetical protein
MRMHSFVISLNARMRARTSTDGECDSLTAVLASKSEMLHGHTVEPASTDNFPEPFSANV